CCIMDIADDIAYSTYDIEDAFKAGLLDPLSSMFPYERVVEAVAEEVSKVRTNQGLKRVSTGDVLDRLATVFADLVDILDSPPGRHLDLSQLANIVYAS